MEPTTKLGADLVVGDVVCERDGAALTIAAIDRRGSWVTMIFERYGSLVAGSARVRATAKVRVVVPEES